jgi:hypothetical protein
MTLQFVQINFGITADVSIPTFLKPLSNKEKEQFRVGNRILFESVELDTEDGRILHIFDAELYEHDYNYGLRLFVQNKIDQTIWFKIIMHLDRSKKFIQRLEFTPWEKIQVFNKFWK